MPTLLVWVERDTLVPVEIGNQFQHYMGHADLSVIPSAGHNPIWDRSEVFNRIVLAFLEASPYRTGW